MAKKHESCKNCDKNYQLDFDFCPYCGQKNNESLTVGVLFYNTISNYFSVDARFFKSFFPLLFKPGYLASKFIEGKRLLYLHPAQMYLFISIVFFFIISFSTRNFVEKVDNFENPIGINDNSITTPKTLNLKTLDTIEQNKIASLKSDNTTQVYRTNEDIAIVDSILNTDTGEGYELLSAFRFNKGRIDSLVKQKVPDEIIMKEMGMSESPSFFERRMFKNSLKLAKGRGAGVIVQAFFDSIPISMFILLPVFALILMLFFFKRGAYAHHLVFSFYFFAYLFTVFSILFVINRFVFTISDAINVLIVISTYLYFLIAVKRFYKQGWWLSWLKTGVITFVFIMLILPMSFVVLAFSAFLMF